MPSETTCSADRIFLTMKPVQDKSSRSGAQLLSDRELLAAVVTLQALIVLATSAFFLLHDGHTYGVIFPTTFHVAPDASVRGVDFYDSDAYDETSLFHRDDVSGRRSGIDHRPSTATPRQPDGLDVTSPAGRFLTQTCIEGFLEHVPADFCYKSPGGEVGVAPSAGGLCPSGRYLPAGSSLCYDDCQAARPWLTNCGVGACAQSEETCTDTIVDLSFNSAMSAAELAAFFLSASTGGAASGPVRSKTGRAFLSLKVEDSLRRIRDEPGGPKTFSRQAADSAWHKYQQISSRDTQLERTRFTSLCSAVIDSLYANAEKTLAKTDSAAAGDELQSHPDLAEVIDALNMCGHDNTEASVCADAIYFATTHVDPTALFGLAATLLRPTCPEAEAGPMVEPVSQKRSHRRLKEADEDEIEISGQCRRDAQAAGRHACAVLSKECGHDGAPHRSSKHQLPPPTLGGSSCAQAERDECLTVAMSVFMGDLNCAHIIEEGDTYCALTDGQSYMEAADAIISSTCGPDI